jgi:hypothetical protein
MQGALFQTAAEACPFCKRKDGSHVGGCVRDQASSAIERTTAKRHTVDTSRQAADSVAPHVGKIQADVLRWFMEHRRGTDEDLASGLEHLYTNGLSTLRTRRSELVDKRFLRDSGKREANSRGRNMVVWELVECS